MRYFWINILFFLSLFLGVNTLLHHLNQSCETEVSHICAELKGEQEKEHEFTSIEWRAILAYQSNTTTSSSVPSPRVLSYRSIVDRIFFSPLKQNGESNQVVTLNYLQKLFKEKKAFEQSGGYYIYALRKIII